MRVLLGRMDLGFFFFVDGLGNEVKMTIAFSMVSVAIGYVPREKLVRVCCRENGGKLHTNMSWLMLTRSAKYVGWRGWRVGK